MARLDQARIKSTLTNKNLIVRNLQVTAGYYRLAQGMKRLIGSRNVSWVGFATHASKTAGQAIRHELMPKRMKSALVRAAGYDETFMFFKDSLMDTSEESENTGRIAEALRRVSLLVSEGNVIVYAELAGPFLSLIHEFSNLWDREDGRFEGFLDAHLRAGAVEDDGQDLLFEAFTAYYHARFETDPKRKAEHVFHGNMMVGLHEQTRLQPFIERALLTPLTLFGSPDEAGATPTEQSRSLQTVMKWGTRMLMSLNLPNRELRLGQDVVAPTGIVNFPQDLISLEDQRVKELVLGFDTGLNTLSGSAADNWASLDDRMSFIVDLFRSYQQYNRLFEKPFLDEQIAAIEAGHLPAGPL